jgi:hypothetical protein
MRSHCVHRYSTLAGPCDAVIDIYRSRDCKAADAYFFFRRFVFFAPFFAADFVFVFRFFAIAALLAILRWRCRNSARANRKHCIPITTVQRKNQRLHLTKRVWPRIDTSCCAWTRAPTGIRALHDTNGSQCRAFSRDCLEAPIPRAFSNDRFFIVERFSGCLRCARAIAMPEKSAGSASINHVEKIFVRTLASGLRALDSDANRANRFKVIRCRVHRRTRFSPRDEATRDNFDD